MLIAIERRPDWDDLCDYASQVILFFLSSILSPLTHPSHSPLSLTPLCHSPLSLTPLPPSPFPALSPSLTPSFSLPVSPSLRV